MYGHKTWAEAFDTGKIFIASRLINFPFTPELCLFGDDRNTIGLDSTVPTTLTHQFVYQCSLCRIWEFTALSSTSLLRAAGLIIDNNGNTLNASDVLLYTVVIIPMENLHTLRKTSIWSVLPWLIGHNYNFLSPFG